MTRTNDCSPQRRARSTQTAFSHSCDVLCKTDGSKEERCVMQRNKYQFTINALLLVVFATMAVSAAGPLRMWNAEQRIPYRWDVTSPVKIYTDIGPFEVLPANPPA